MTLKESKGRESKRKIVFGCQSSLHHSGGARAPANCFKERFAKVD